MALVQPNQAETLMLENFVNKTPPEDLVLRLYVNNITPGETDTVATYTEAGGYGYSAANLTASSWSVVEGDPSTADYPEVTFSFTSAAGDIYGYYVTETTSGKLKWAERFSDGPYNIKYPGEKINITLRLTGG